MTELTKEGMSSRNKYLTSMARGAGITFVLTIMGYLLIFVFKLIAARYLGPEKIGLYSLYETVIGIAVMLAALGMIEGLPRFATTYFTQKKFALLKGYLSFVKWGTLLSAFIVGTLLFILAPAITRLFDFPELFTNILRFGALMIPLNVHSRFLRRCLVSKQKFFFQKFNAEVLERIFLLLALFLLIFFELNFLFLFAFILVSKIVALALDRLAYAKHIQLPKNVAPSYKKRRLWIGFSLPLLLTGMFSFIVSWTDNLFVGGIMSAADLGVYSITFSLAAFLVFFQKSFNPIFLPIISESYAKKDSASIRMLYRKSAAWIFTLTLPIALLFIFYARPVIAILYGALYLAGAVPLSILSVGMLVIISTGLSRQILVLYGKTRLLFYVNLGVSIFNIVANLLLVPLYGLIGAAVSSAVSFSLQQLLLLYFANRHEGVSLDWRYMLKGVLAGSISVLVSVVLYRVLGGPGSIVAAIISLVSYGALYVVLLFLLRTFDKDDIYILMMLQNKKKILPSKLVTFLKKKYK